MNRIQASALLFIGLALGSLATVAAPIATSYAQSSSGGATWDCFVVDRLPDVQVARSWGPATDITNGLNRAAPDAAKGTMIAVNPKGSAAVASVACVKH